MINMDSFGSICPANWEEIASYLNSKIEIALNEAGETADTPEGNDIICGIWEAYCNGDYPDAPAAE